MAAPPAGRDGRRYCGVAAGLVGATHLERQLGVVWVGGEVSNLYRASSGHVYFTLKTRRRRFKCTLWRSKAQLVPFPLADGLAVEVRATPSIYEQKGESSSTSTPCATPGSARSTSVSCA